MAISICKIFMYPRMSINALGHILLDWYSTVHICKTDACDWWHSGTKVSPCASQWLKSSPRVPSWALWHILGRQVVVQGGNTENVIQMPLGVNVRNCVCYSLLTNTCNKHSVDVKIHRSRGHFLWKHLQVLLVNEFFFNWDLTPNSFFLK